MCKANWNWADVHSAGVFGGEFVCIGVKRVGDDLTTWVYSEHMDQRALYCLPAVDESL